MTSSKLEHLQAACLQEGLDVAQQCTFGAARIAVEETIPPGVALAAIAELTGAQHAVLQLMVSMRSTDDLDKLDKLAHAAADRRDQIVEIVTSLIPELAVNEKRGPVQ